MSVVRRIQIGENHKSAEVLNAPADDIITLSGLTRGADFPGFAVRGTGTTGVVTNVLDYATPGTPINTGLNPTAVLAAFTAAFTATATTGGTVFVPPGTYALSAPLVRTGNTSLVGVPDRSILLFTGATDGIQSAGTTAPFPQTFVSGLVIRTSNAAGGKALSYQSTQYCTVRDVYVDATGSGKWAYEWWSNNSQSMAVYGLRLLGPATVPMRIENFCNALKFYDLEIQGGLITTGTTHGIEVDSCYDPQFIGGTAQGYFAQSAAYCTNGSGVNFIGFHFENTNLAPSDGYDVVLGDTTSLQSATMMGCKGANIGIGLNGAVVRNVLISGGEGKTNLTFGSTAQGCLAINFRCTTITDNGNNNVIACGNGTGTAFANKIVMHTTGNTGVIPTGIVAPGYGVVNGAGYGVVDSGGVMQSLLFASAADSTFLQYKATKSIFFRTTGGTTRASINDSGLVIGASGTAISEVKKYTPTLTPAATAANTTVEQTFTVTGLAVGDQVLVNPPGHTVGINMGAARVTATDTLAIAFANVTAGSLTAPSGVYRITEIR